MEAGSGMTKLQLMPHQIEGVEFLRKCGGKALLADIMGLGKTLQAASYITQDSLYPALIVVPAALKDNWVREFGHCSNVECQIISGHTPVDMSRAAMKPITIINYDILQNHETALLRVPWQIVVFDEVHYLASRSSKRTRSAMKLAKKTRRCLGMSGTPVQNHVADLWPILHIIRPDLFHSFLDFGWKYCEPRKTPYGGWEYKGAKNLDKLFELMAPFTLRRTKDVLDLPEKRITTIPMDIPDRSELDKIENDFYNWKRSAKKTGKIAEQQKSMALERLNSLLMATSRLKCKSVVMWARKFLADNPDKKLVLFCTHTQMLETLVRRVYPQGVVSIYGLTKPKDRQRNVDAFQNDPNIRLCVLNLKAGGVGITLTAASVLAHTELWWNPSAINQGTDRIHRLTQTEDCEVYFLVVPDSVEEKLCKMIQSKQDIANAVIDGGKGEALDILNLFEKDKGLLK
jgi:SWI/SNF-related matrix-associated actin-dependent regulator 1 of chromatin subfamily A